MSYQFSVVSSQLVAEMNKQKPEGTGKPEIDFAKI